jgi:adenine deaminase
MDSRRLRPGVVDDLGEFTSAARGAVEADLVLRGGRVVNVFTHEVVETAVALRGDRIVGLGDLQARRSSISMAGMCVRD